MCQARAELAVVRRTRQCWNGACIRGCRSSMRGPCSILPSLALALSVPGGCDAEPEYEADLDELAAELDVTVDVLGTPDPPLPRRIQILLEPGPNATRSLDELCPMVHASATVNGFAIPQLHAGEYVGG